MSSVTTVAPSAQRRIRFDVVTVRSFERVLGDNPAVSAGVPLTLGARVVVRAPAAPAEPRDECKPPRATTPPRRGRPTTTTRPPSPTAAPPTTTHAS